MTLDRFGMILVMTFSSYFRIGISPAALHLFGGETGELVI